MVDSNDHVGFFWFPHTRTAQLKVNNRTTRGIARRPKVDAFLNDQLLSNVGFDIINRIGRRMPKAIPRLISAAMKPGSRVEYVAPGHEVFVSDRRVRFVEMEYAVPRVHLLEAFSRVRSLIDDLEGPISFPIEVRIQRADDIPLGMASERDTGYIAVHVYRGTSHTAYFAAVEQIMADYRGRPHWGKLHSQTAETLAPLYPGWEAFQTVLAELDPDGRFSNPYLDRVLRGPDFKSRSA
ncbi:MAG: D-arabinono-1,4-lactone oxidase [Acidimicrobiales bacterium]